MRPTKKAPGCWTGAARQRRGCHEAADPSRGACRLSARQRLDSDFPGSKRTSPLRPQRILCWRTGAQTRRRFAASSPERPFGLRRLAGPASFQTMRQPIAGTPLPVHCAFGGAIAPGTLLRQDAKRSVLAGQSAALLVSSTLRRTLLSTSQSRSILRWIVWPERRPFQWPLRLVSLQTVPVGRHRPKTALAQLLK